MALEQAIKLHKIRSLMDFIGTGAWQGDLSTMRDDKRKSKRA
jgi:hypothetical protein